MKRPHGTTSAWRLQTHRLSAWDRHEVVMDGPRVQIIVNIVNTILGLYGTLHLTSSNVISRAHLRHKFCLLI